MSSNQGSLPDPSADDGIDRVNQPHSGCPWRYEDCGGPNHCTSGEACNVYLQQKHYKSWAYLMRWVKTRTRP